MKYQSNLQKGEKDSEVEKILKKHRNYCNEMVKKVVKDKTGKNITGNSSLKQIWNSINDVIKPNNLDKHMIKIHTHRKKLLMTHRNWLNHLMNISKKKLKNWQRESKGILVLTLS